jgi:hypothetical protein
MLSPPTMTHNDFDFYEDLIRPLMQFLVQSNILKQATFDSENSECSEDEYFKGNLTAEKSEKSVKERQAEVQAKFI